MERCPTNDRLELLRLFAELYTSCIQTGLPALGRRSQGGQVESRLTPTLVTYGFYGL